VYFADSLVADGDQLPALQEQGWPLRYGFAHKSQIYSEDPA